MKGTGRGKCYHCERVTPYDTMEYNNGQLLCSQCVAAFDVKNTLPPKEVPHEKPTPPTGTQLQQKAKREMEKQYHQAMKITAPPHKPVIFPPKTISQRWADIDTTRLTYLLKGIIYLKYYS